MNRFQVPLFVLILSCALSIPKLLFAGPREDHEGAETANHVVKTGNFANISSSLIGTALRLVSREGKIIVQLSSDSEANQAREELVKRLTGQKVTAFALEELTASRRMPVYNDAKGQYENMDVPALGALILAALAEPSPNFDSWSLAFIDGSKSRSRLTLPVGAPRPGSNGKTLFEMPIEKVVSYFQKVLEKREQDANSTRAVALTLLTGPNSKEKTEFGYSMTDLNRVANPGTSSNHTHLKTNDTKTEASNEDKVIKMKLFPQPTPNTCWAAVISSIIYQQTGKYVSIGELMIKYNNGVDAPTNAGRVLLDYALFTGAESKFNFSKIKQEIDANHPIHFEARRPNDFGHAMLIYGYTPTEKIYVFNPATGQTHIVDEKGALALVPNATEAVYAYTMSNRNP